jgi:predicted metal-dependent phosphotriesterase family hydrolase
MARNNHRELMFSRREALQLIGASAGFALYPELLAQQTPPVAFPRGAIIRTLLKDVAPESLTGPILFHEHLSIDLPPNLNPRPADAPPLPPPQPSPTANLDLIVDEVKAAAKDGVVCIVDGGHPDMHRSLDNLHAIATRTGVAIVASGGYYMERTYPSDLAGRSDDQIAEGLARDAVAQRLGAFGEIGENADAAMSELEKKVFRAVGKAHLRTNLPVFTHNAYGTGPSVPKTAGLQQLDVLESVGVKPERVVIGHTCCLDDPSAEVIIAIAKRGAFVGFDRVTAGRVPDDRKVAMLLKFFEAGYASRLLLSSDLTGARTLDLPGYGRTLTVFAPKLRAAGVSEAMVHSILVDNPRRFLAFVPKA